jgi:hypothetical protein
MLIRKVKVNCQSRRPGPDDQDQGDKNGKFLRKNKQFALILPFPRPIFELETTRLPPTLALAQIAAKCPSRSVHSANTFTSPSSSLVEA